MIPNKKLDDFANKASKDGMTYGKMQAQETIAQTKPFVIPEGYTKIGDRDGNKQKES